jgi:hypothetical protein
MEKVQKNSMNSVHHTLSLLILFLATLLFRLELRNLSEVNSHFPYSLISSRHGPRTENTAPLLLHGADHVQNTCQMSDCEFIGPLAALGETRAPWKTQSHILLRG